MGLMLGFCEKKKKEKKREQGEGGTGGEMKRARSSSDGLDVDEGGE